jgi:predicted transposase YdaD
MSGSGGVMVEPSSPHDALFKSAFSNPENAAALFRAILPERLLEKLDLSTLTVEPGSYVDDQLASSHSDLLFSVELDARPAFLYTLLEHQSMPHVLMPLRVLKYMLRIWDRYVDDRGGGKQALPLPFIIPIVVHHGEDGWSAAVRLEELFDEALAEELELGPLVPRLEFLLDDLSGLSDAELRRRAHGLGPALSLWALRDARNSGRLESSAQRWLGALVELARAESGREALAVIFRYLCVVADESVTLTLYTALSEQSPQAKDTLMTLEQTLLARGEARGEARGKTDAKVKAVLDVLEVRTLPVSAEQRAHIERCTDLELLDRWLRAAVTVSATSELFAISS